MWEVSRRPMIEVTKEQSQPRDQMSRSEVGAGAKERSEQRTFRRERGDWSSVTTGHVTRDVVITWPRRLRLVTPALAACPTLLSCLYVRGLQPPHFCLLRPSFVQIFKRINITISVKPCFVSVCVAHFSWPCSFSLFQAIIWRWHDAMLRFVCFCPDSARPILQQDTFHLVRSTATPHYGTGNCKIRTSLGTSSEYAVLQFCAG